LTGGCKTAQDSWPCGQETLDDSGFILIHPASQDKAFAPAWRMHETHQNGEMPYWRA